MSAHHRIDAVKPDPAEVVSKAVMRAAERLAINGTTLSRVLGLSQPSLSRMAKGEFLINEKSKQWEFALIFLRIFRSLDSIVGNDEAAKRWINSNNLGLGAKPIELITSTEGIVRVSNYLDASRATN